MSSEFRRALDAEIEQVEEALAWEFHLSINEYVWGSAYGPWPPLNLRGLDPILALRADPS